MATSDIKPKIKIVITTGEPAGIGPDICLALPAASTFDDAELYVIADPELISRRAHQLGTDIQIQTHKNTEELSDHYQA